MLRGLGKGEHALLEPMKGFHSIKLSLNIHAQKGCTAQACDMEDFCCRGCSC